MCCTRTIFQNYFIQILIGSEQSPVKQEDIVDIGGNFGEPQKFGINFEKLKSISVGINTFIVLNPDYYGVHGVDVFIRLENLGCQYIRYADYLSLANAGEWANESAVDCGCVGAVSFFQPLHKRQLELMTTNCSQQLLINVTGFEPEPGINELGLQLRHLKLFFENTIVLCPTCDGISKHYFLVVFDTGLKLAYLMDSLKYNLNEYEAQKYFKPFAKRVDNIIREHLKKEAGVVDYNFVPLEYLGQRDGTSCGPLTVDYLYRFLSALNTETGQVDINAASLQGKIYFHSFFPFLVLNYLDFLFGFF